MSEKFEARRAAFARRKTAHGAGLDGAAQAHLKAFLGSGRGRVLSGYMPIRTEINPLPVMAEWDGPVCIPVILGDGQPLEFHRWTSATKLIEGPFGAAVPEDGEPLEPDVLVVPLVAFDAGGYRLGYGGGFYDRTLEGLRARKQALAVGFAYGLQEAADLPREATDQKLDAIVTEAGVRRFG